MPHHRILSLAKHIFVASWKAYHYFCLGKHLLKLYFVWKRSLGADILAGQFALVDNYYPKYVATKVRNLLANLSIVHLRD